jgi:DNA-binding YbaB/EbfC family protein
VSEGFDMSNLLAQAQEMQQQLLQAKEAAAEKVVEGSSGGGVVKVVVTGALEFRSVTIDPKAVDPSDVDMLQDLVLAAIHDAMDKANDLNQDALGGLGDMLGGAGLGGLLGP